MPEIGLMQLAFCLLPCFAIAWLSHIWGGSAKELIVATLRMVAQLLAIGFALVLLFQAQNPLVGFGVVGVMIAASSLISVRLIRENKAQALLHAVIALGLVGTAVLLFVLVVVLQLAEPFYQPRVIIPIAGMIYFAAMNAVSLAAERLDSNLIEGHEFFEARTAAWRASLIPQINGLLAVGLVSLPGMMTGQILSGVDPLVAVRYQIVVMAMLLQVSAGSVAVFLWLRGRARAQEGGAGLA